MTEYRFQTLAQLLAVTVIACVCESAAAEQISLAPEAWEIRFSYDMPKRPMRMDRVGLSTRFRSMCSDVCRLEAGLFHKGGPSYENPKIVA